MHRPTDSKSAHASSQTALRGRSSSLRPSLPPSVQHTNQNGRRHFSTVTQWTIIQWAAAHRGSFLLSPSLPPSLPPLPVAWPLCAVTGQRDRAPEIVQRDGRRQRYALFEEKEEDWRRKSFFLYISLFLPSFGQFLFSIRREEDWRRGGGGEANSSSIGSLVE